MSTPERPEIRPGSPVPVINLTGLGLASTYPDHAGTDTPIQSRAPGPKICRFPYNGPVDALAALIPTAKGRLLPGYYKGNAS
jgi:hypothetical protein